MKLQLLIQLVPVRLGFFRAFRRGPVEAALAQTPEITALMFFRAFRRGPVEAYFWFFMVVKARAVFPRLPARPR